MADIQLPNAFREKMKHLLGEEYPEFLQSFSLPRTQGLRLNTLKVSIPQFLELSPFLLRQVNWVSEGFYYSAKDRPGKHPYHAAGLYYIQEPSAMVVVNLLDPQPGEKVLDLCAAPGGKATHIAARMQGQGILVANEFIPGRAKILAENMERMGVIASLILNEHPKILAELFPRYFDRILVDAPCSGEGMFRKDPEACTEWSPENVAMCAERQVEILQSALKMLRPGGTLVYSTCTFGPEENEHVVSRLLHSHSGLELVEYSSRFFTSGRPECTANPQDLGLAKTLRIWPHLLEGEGHFAALMKYTCDSGHYKPATREKPKVPPIPKESLALWQSFANSTLDGFTLEGVFQQYGEHLYLTRVQVPNLQGIRVIRPGWHLGMVKKKRFEPSHALALGLKPENLRNCVSLTAEDPQVLCYLRGHTLNFPAFKGWKTVCVDGFPLGWGKHDGEQLKNHYPKGLRWT